MEWSFAGFGILDIVFFYGSSLLYVENEPFFSRDIFRRFDASSSKQQQASPEHSIYLYDPVDIIVENSFSSEAAYSQDCFVW